MNQTNLPPPLRPPAPLHPITKAFNLQSPALVAIVGGGGKSSLMFALAAALPGRVVLTTTTRIFAVQMKKATAVIQFNEENAAAFDDKVSDALAEHGRCLVVGQVIGEKAHGVPPELPGQLLARSDVDYVLVEADGSRMRPIKAPAEHEPVIPPQATHVIPVVGIDALDEPLADVAHRPERVANLLATHHSSLTTHYLSVKDVATLLAHPQGGAKGIPDGAQLIPLINKVETAVQLKAARQIAQHVLKEARGKGQGASNELANSQTRKLANLQVKQLVIGAIQSAQPVREVHQRVTAVLLAAGQSKRMGRTKQLLPWGKTTVLGQTIRNIKETAVSDMVVVSGHRAAEIEAIATAEGVRTLHNPHYAQSEMVGSLQTAVSQLAEKETAVLVMLADQPMVSPAIVEQLLIAYWQGKGKLIAPTYKGRRGNPVLIGRDYFAELLALSPDEPPRTLLQKYANDLYFVPVKSDAILRDLDSEAVYERERP